MRGEERYEHIEQGLEPVNPAAAVCFEANQVVRDYLCAQRRRRLEVAAQNSARLAPALIASIENYLADEAQFTFGE